MVISNEQVQQIHSSSRIAKKKAVGALPHQVTIDLHNSITVEKAEHTA